MGDIGEGADVFIDLTLTLIVEKVILRRGGSRQTDTAAKLKNSGSQG